MQCTEIQELIFLDAVGAADEPMRSAVSRHLQDGCIECQAAQAEAKATAAMLPIGLAPATPTPALKASLLERLPAQRTSATPTQANVEAKGHRAADNRPARRPALWPMVITLAMAAAFAIVAILSIDSNASLAKDRQAEMLAVAALKGSLARDSINIHKLSATMTHLVLAQQQKISFLQARLKNAMALEKMVGSPALEMASLQGLAPMRAAWGRVMWNHKLKMWKLCAFNLPALPADKTYEVWMITAKGKKMPAGLFKPDPKTRSIMMTPTLPPHRQIMTEIAVTIEPAGGSLQPTGAVLLAGRINSSL